MDKTAIKNFAIWARNKLITEITYKAGLLGITENEIKDPLPQSTNDVQFFDIGTKEPYSISGIEITQRRELAEEIQQKANQSDYVTAYQSVIEEVAYTWFNRLIAVRFMEVNDYLPSGIRVLSSESKGKIEPDLVTAPFDADLYYTSHEKELIIQFKNVNHLDELFRMLFIKQCNALNAILPELFEKTNDYTELLMNISYTDQDGVVYHLIHDILEDNFNVKNEGQVEIIGWLYQYYNTEPKAEADALKSKNVKITKEFIPAATQLFTPEWIVRYMVENSLGRLWLERERASSGLSDEYLNGSYFGWKYYLEEAEQEPEVEAQLVQIREEYKTINPEDIKFIDPCMGSGHILVYAFDVLMQIYESSGYNQRDAAKSIVENNLYGLDIDTRAYQLAYFAVMMKARQYNRRILNGETTCNLYFIQESNGINPEQLEYFGVGMSDIDKKTALRQMEYLLDIMQDAKEYGSIINLENLNWSLLKQFIDSRDNTAHRTFGDVALDDTQAKLIQLVKITRVMAQKYDVVVTNPPYMGSNHMDAKLSDFVKNNYPNSKGDLFAVFIEKGNSMVKRNGYNCMVTMQSWMFLSSFEKMRKEILSTKIIANLMHMENMVMGIAFGTAVGVFRNCELKGFKGTYNQITLTDIENGYPIEFPIKENRYAQISTESFYKIPGIPIAYWASKQMLSAFTNGEILKEKGDTRQGMATSDNNRFLRVWYEVSIPKIGFHCESAKKAMEASKKWYPYNKGGQFRKWYGNMDYIINYENDGKEVKQYATNLYKTPSRTITSMSEYFKECLSWSKISSSNSAFRYYPYGFVFDVAGCCIFFSNYKYKLYMLGFLNSIVSREILSVISPTLNYEAGQIASLPMIYDNRYFDQIDEIVMDNISTSKMDWDSLETSWDFARHPFLIYLADSHLLSESYLSWEGFTNQQFKRLKTNEEELNRIFIEIYGFKDELNPKVEDKNVTIRKAELARDVQSFISYAVGCMFGRYSLDIDGLIYAGGEWDDSKYSTFIPNKDNILLISDEEYFEDDIVNLFCTFLKNTFGAETLEENLDFIANAISNRGNTSREIIRNYFLKDFFKDHCKIYKKRPIYWLFDSGRSGGFKALIYLHRYNADTIGKLRIDYLHQMQRVYENEILRMQEIIENSGNAREVTAATKRKEKLTKQLKESREYDEKIAHLALARTAIDLDDGVKVNYEKIQTDVDGKKLNVLAKI